MCNVSVRSVCNLYIYVVYNHVKNTPDIRRQASLIWECAQCHAMSLCWNVSDLSTMILKERTETEYRDTNLDLVKNSLYFGIYYS